MNKNDLTAAIAEKADVDATTAASVISAFQEVVTDAVAQGDQVALSGFLTFDRVDKAATTARNPQTGEAVQVAAKKVPRVKIGTQFKRAVNI